MLKNTRELLHAYIAGVIRNQDCHSYIVNGVEDHLHILTHLHPSKSLAGLVKTIKVASHAFIDNSGIFPDFNGWQNGYAAFTYSKEARSNLIRYIKGQEEHHRNTDFEKEYMTLLEKQGVRYDLQYLFESERNL